MISLNFFVMITTLYLRYINVKSLKNNLKSTRKQFVFSNDEKKELQYLDEFLDNNNELIDLSPIIQNLTNFIEKCYYQYKSPIFNTTINNRRKLIFYIIQEINEKHISLE